MWQKVTKYEYALRLDVLAWRIVGLTLYNVFLEILNRISLFIHKDCL